MDGAEVQQIDLVGVIEPTWRARALVGALRYGLRPVIDRVPGRFVRPALLRSVVEVGAFVVRADPRTRLGRYRVPRTCRLGSCPLEGELLRPRRPRDGAILYLHGGAYAFCSPRTHRVMTGRLAVETGLPVLVPRYRLAPEHPYPAAFDDAVTAYRYLLDQGLPASRIVVAGDSSGGHLATAVAMEACRSGLPRPAGVVLFSPWIDLRCESFARMDGQRRDPLISPVLARRFGRLYAGDADLAGPGLSLMDSAGLDLPPFLIQVGGAEVLRGDVEEFARSLAEAGAPCDLQVWPGQMHDFQLFTSILPAARAAIVEAGRFTHSAIARTPPHGPGGEG